MFCMKKNLLLLVLILKVLFIQAQSEKISFNNSAIILDGKLEEPIWNELEVYGGFTNYEPKNSGLATKKTEVKIFHNGTNLYISAIYYDDTPNSQISSLKRDDIRNSGAGSDSFAMIIDTYNQQQSGYFFIVNMGGALIDALVVRDGESFNPSTSWNTVWNAKTSTKGNLKIFEVEIPLKALGYTADNQNWGLLFHTRDIKTNEWTTYTHMDRNFSLFDLRFAKTFKIEGLTNSSSSRFSVTPSITTNYQEDVVENTKDSSFKPSVDIQYNLSSSLKLDATINPDFSQIDVDTQVTNLSRFSVFFPERRNFFLENSDLFTNLGASGVNPFYSRRIGAESDILFGLKLSGNIAKKTRLGVLNASTKEKGEIPAQNYGALVLQQQLSNAFTATGFLINRQQTKDFTFLDNYNRVGGINLNYNSKNNKWTGLANYGKSFTNDVSSDTDFYNVGIWYSTANLSWDASLKQVDKNYITDVGFVPRLTNYDAINDITIREGFTNARTKLKLTSFPKNSKTINAYDYVYLENIVYWDKQGMLTQFYTFFNQELWFNDRSSVLVNLYHEYENLKYGFDLLGNGNSIQPGEYNYGAVEIRYKSVSNRKFGYDLKARYGSHYNGTRSKFDTDLQYRLLPFAKLRLRYTINAIDLKELGSKTFHLARFTGEVFFSNRLNWTTYIQYNNQIDNFNINSRLQWEYRPLSYIYLVVSDNYNDNIHRKNWGVAFKMNYRFDF